MIESIYVPALAIELRKRNLEVQERALLPAFYKGESLGISFEVDLIVNEKVLVQVHSVKELQDVDFKRLISYLKQTKKKLGIIVNFNVADIKTGIHRKVNCL